MRAQTRPRPVAVAVLVAALFLAFWLGRLSRGARQVSDPSPDSAPSSAASRLLRQGTKDTSRPDAADWNALAHAAGLYEHKPPLAPAPTGIPYYVIQPFQILSHHPRIIVFPNFIDRERARTIQALAVTGLSQSSLALKRGDTASSTHDVRTSQGTFLQRSQDPSGTLAWVEERIAQVTGIPATHGEAFNVLKYELGQHYHAHHDVFDPADYGPQASTRVATVLLYLEAPREGGETVFPLEGVDGMRNMAGYNYKTCDRGYLYRPRDGDAVLFWSIGPDGKFDKRSLHGGCPVKAGTKWVATKWIRDKALA